MMTDRLDFCLLTNNGYLTYDESKGGICYCKNIDDAAYFTPRAALELQSKLESCAIMSLSGKLMLLSVMQTLASLDTLN